MSFYLNRTIINLVRAIETNLIINNPKVLNRDLGKRFSDAAVTKECREEEAVAAEPHAHASTSQVAPFVDSFGRRHDYLRISLTERCNLRCQYCMPAEGVPLSPREQLLRVEELQRLARVFAAGGVRKVRLTGGEPTLRRDLPQLVAALRTTPGIGAVAMTTNGLVLTRQLPALQRAGLTALNVSLDSLRPERYERMARRPGLKRVLAGVDLALQLGYRPVKINTVLMKGFNDDEIGDFVEYTRDREVEVRFIEFMPFAGNRWEGGKMVPHRDAVRALLRAQPAAEPLPPRPSDTAVVWRAPGFAGSVGFISSMTRPFCGSCNRMRLTADGNLKVCLFGAAEVNLRDHARAGASDRRLDELIRDALRKKHARHAGKHPALGAAAPAAERRLHLPPCCRHGEHRAHGQPAHDPHRRLAARGYCTFSHLDARGRAAMVDVGAKAATVREAEARCSLRVGAPLLRLLRDRGVPKGDALAAARLAGVMGAKRTPELVPLCHSLPLDSVRVHVRLPEGVGADGGAIEVSCVARATARTGVEMEALTGAAVAALALYDMCKAVDRSMRIEGLRVVRKSGGKRDFAEADSEPSQDDATF